jgi:hypothetical protein
MDQRKSRPIIFGLACIAGACTTIPEKPAWVQGDEVRGFFTLGCSRREDGSYQNKYFSLIRANIQMTFIYGRDTPCKGKPGVVIVMRRKLPKTHWIAPDEFVWGMPKAGEGYLIVSPGDKAKLMIQEAEKENGQITFDETEKQAIIETGVVPVPLVQDLCYWKGRFSEDGRGFELAQAPSDKGCFASFDDAKMANKGWGPLHVWTEKPVQPADDLYDEADTQYHRALARFTEPK